jgi:hypothetical protein
LKIFVCNRTIDADTSSQSLDRLLSISGESIAILREREHSDNWKERVESQLKEIDFVIFFVGHETFKRMARGSRVAKGSGRSMKHVFPGSGGVTCGEDRPFAQAGGRSALPGIGSISKGL